MRLSLRGSKIKWSKGTKLLLELFTQDKKTVLKWPGQVHRRPSYNLSTHKGCGMQKGPQCPESLSYQKKEGGPARPPFFLYDTDFL